MDKPFGCKDKPCELDMQRMMRRVTDCGELPEASRPVAGHDSVHAVITGPLYMTTKLLDADRLHLLGPPESRDIARSETCCNLEQSQVEHRR
ncbi:TPA: hypothetical protein ACH3X1_013017 [Trebouxia sp. C0004]